MPRHCHDAAYYYAMLFRLLTRDAAFCRRHVTMLAPLICLLIRCYARCRHVFIRYYYACLRFHYAFRFPDYAAMPPPYAATSRRHYYAIDAITALSPTLYFSPRALICCDICC